MLVGLCGKPTALIVHLAPTVLIFSSMFSEAVAVASRAWFPKPAWPAENYQVMYKDSSGSWDDTHSLGQRTMALPLESSVGFSGVMSRFQRYLGQLDAHGMLAKGEASAHRPSLETTEK